MAKLQFSRNAKVYITNVANQPNFVWSIPVLDGFSFSQATNSSEITLNEMADASGNSRRGRQMFNDSYAPAEWSFSTYILLYQQAEPKDCLVLMLQQVQLLVRLKKYYGHKW